MSASSTIPATLEALPDDQLMLAYAAGDKNAFETLYARHEVALLRYVRRLLGLRLAGEAPQVFRNCWLQVIMDRDNFATEGLDWQVWTWRIANELAMDQLRLSGREAVFHAHDEDGDGIEAAQLFSRGLLREGADGERGAGAAEGSDEKLAFWRAAGRRLLACLDELPDEQRAAYLLYEEDGFSIAGVAAILDVEEASVDLLLDKSLLKLRACMERYLMVLAPLNDADEDFEDDVDPRDEHLRRALAEAPDRGVIPDWRMRKALLASAAGEEEVAAALPQPRGPGFSKRPIVFALLAVLVAGVVLVVFRQRESERFAGLDGAIQAASLSGGGGDEASGTSTGSASTRLDGDAKTVGGAGGGSAALIPELSAPPGTGTGAGVATSLPTAPAPAPSAASTAAGGTQATVVAQAPVAAPAPVTAPSPSASTSQAAAPAAAPSPSVASVPAPATSQPSVTAQAPTASPSTVAASGASASPAPAATQASSASQASPASSVAQAPTTPTTSKSATTSQTAAATSPAPASTASPTAATPATAATTATPPPTSTPTKLAASTPTPVPATPPAAPANPSPDVAAILRDTPPKVALTPLPSTTVAAATPSTSPPNPAQDNIARLAALEAAAARARANPGAPPQVPPPIVASGTPAARATAPPAAAAASSTVRTDETDPPTFQALSQWNRITIAHDGAGRTLARAEVPDLNGYLGSAAISAVGPRPLSTKPEWKATLQLNNQVLAVLEVAEAQVRWREGKTPSATGVPSAQALVSLRQALGDALRLPVETAQAAPSAPPGSGGGAGSATDSAEGAAPPRP